MPKSYEELLEYAQNYYDIKDDIDVLSSDCNILEYMFDNCEIIVPDDNRFFVNTNFGRMQNLCIQKRANKFKETIAEVGLSDGEEALAYTGIYDFGHTTTEWETVIELGIYGLRQRIDSYLSKTTDEKKLRFYRELARVYDAALRFMQRAADQARKIGKNEMADSLIKLTKNSPENLFEALQTSMVYFVMQHYFECTVLRTLGRLDKLFYPFYVKEDRAYARQLFIDYFHEFNSKKVVANTPFTLGGTDIEGNCLINELSYELLDIYRNSHLPDMKFHLLYSDNTPTDIIEQALCAAREGNNSIVFMSDSKIIESLKKIGAEHKDAVNYHIVGCYECGSVDELTCSCNARVNLPKALELALNNGRDMLTDKLIGIECKSQYNTFEELYSQFLLQVRYLSQCAIKVTDIYEANYRYIHSAPVLSAAYTSAMNNGGDLYCDYSAKYNNSSVNALGLGTTVDSLVAIKKLVFEDKTISLNELTDILKSNWEGNEQLRLTIKNKFPKFGTGDKKVDIFAKEITDILADEINGKPNVKGGVYRLGLFSIDWRWQFGEKTAASADGRLAGETISQNSSASFGADKEGATAHLLSVASIDASNTPNATIVDIDLHSSAVKGENGLKTLLASLKTYFELGGFAVHYNILDTDVLKDAKLNPDKYPNLQVRLCGWNVLFSSLSEKEKDEFIARSIK